MTILVDILLFIAGLGVGSLLVHWHLARRVTAVENRVAVGVNAAFGAVSKDMIALHKRVTDLENGVVKVLSPVGNA